MAPIETTKPVVARTKLVCDRTHAEFYGSVYVGHEGDSEARVKALAVQNGWHVATVALYKDGVRTDETITKVLCPRHAKERSLCPHAPEQHLIWKAQDGPVAICQMDDAHLENALRFIADRNKYDQGQCDRYRGFIAARAPYYQQMYLEKARREGTNVVSGGAGAPMGTMSVKELPASPPLKMQRYDLVKELQPGEHVVVSRKADKGMVLNIDEDTVRALYHVLQHVGGFPDSPRRFTEALLNAIAEAIPESEWLQPWEVFPSGDAEGTIHFLNPEELAEKRKRQQIMAARRTGPVGGSSEPADFYEEL